MPGATIASYVGAAIAEIAGCFAFWAWLRLGKSPLWLVPGMGLVLPLFWMAWLNRRTFAYDALAVHATDAEWRSIRRAHAFPLLGLGLLMALLVYLPFIGLLAPALAALAYVHYCLEALRGLRQGAVGSDEKSD